MLTEYELLLISQTPLLSGGHATSSRLWTLEKVLRIVFRLKQLKARQLPLPPSPGSAPEGPPAPENTTAR